MTRGYSVARSLLHKLGLLKKTATKAPRDPSSVDFAVCPRTNVTFRLCRQQTARFGSY
jgi:hypothetical protein